MHYLLTHDGLYGFHMANLWVRNDGKEYTMEADWADNCGELVKRLAAALGPNVLAQGRVAGLPAERPSGAAGCASRGEE